MNVMFGKGQQSIKSLIDLFYMKKSTKLFLVQYLKECFMISNIVINYQTINNV